MKKTLLFLCCFSSIVASGQKIIPIVGVSRSNFSASPLYGPENFFSFRTGLLIGAEAERPLKGRFKWQPALVFVQKGASSGESISFKGSSISYHRSIRIDYLQATNAFKVYFGSTQKFFLTGGTYFALGLGGKNQINWSPASYSQPIDGKVVFGKSPWNPDSDLHFDNRFDFGFCVGAGFLFFNRIMLDFRFDAGTISLYKTSIDILNEYFRNKSFQLAIGYPISLKRGNKSVTQNE